MQSIVTSFACFRCSDVSTHVCIFKIIFRLHRVNEMPPILTHDRSVCQFVCLSRGSICLRCAKLAERTKMLFGVNTPGGPWNIVLDKGLDPHLLLNFGTPSYLRNSWSYKLEILLACRRLGTLTKLCKSRSFGVEGGVT